MMRMVGRAIAVALALGAACLLAAGCGEETSDAISAFEKGGLQVGAESDERLVFIGAPQDTSVKVNGRDVLIYRFSDRDDLRDGVIAIEDIIRAGTGLWGYDANDPASAYHERGLYIVYFGDHPDADRIRTSMDAHIRYTRYTTVEEAEDSG